MTYTICEYMLQNSVFNIYRLEHIHSELTCKKAIDFIRHYTGHADALTIYIIPDSSLLDINILEKTYEYYPIYDTTVDKTMLDYINTLIKQLKEHGYVEK